MSYVNEKSTIHSSNENYLKKVKKQAKRLLQYAKQNADLTVSNLAQAQEILAQINGYPNWYALEKTISEPQKNIVVENKLDESYQKHAYKLTEKIGDYFIQRDEEEIKSFFTIEEIQTANNYELLQYINGLKNKLSFYFDMGFHNFELFFYKKQKEMNEDKNYNLISLAKNWNISPELAKELFEIKHEDFKTVLIDEYDFKIVIGISTIKEMQDEHIDLCKELELAFSSGVLSQKTIFTENELILEQDNLDNKEKVEFPSAVWKKLFKMNCDSNLALFALHNLLKRNYNWNIVLDWKNEKIDFYYDKVLDPLENQKNKHYLEGFIKSIDASKEKEVIFKDITYEPLVHKTVNDSIQNGLAMKSLLTGKINYFDDTKLKEIEFVLGKPGAGKNILLNTKKLNTLLSHDKKELPYMGMIESDTDSLHVLNTIKKMLPKEQQNQVQYHRIQMDKKFCINLFDTTLGSRFPSFSQYKNLFLLMKELININNGAFLNINTLIEEVIEKVYRKRSDGGDPYQYNKGENVEIDKVLKEINFKEKENTTWWNVVDALFDANKIEEATLAQRHAVPVLSDVRGVVSMLETQSQMNVSTKTEAYKPHLKEIQGNIKEAIEKYPLLSHRTVLNLNDAKIICLNLQDVINNSKDNLIMFLWAGNIMNNYISSKSDLFASQSFTKIFNLSDNENNIVNKYKTYYESQHEKTYLYFTDLHRIGNNYIIEEVIKVINVTRKTNIILSSQAIGSFNSIKRDIGTVYMLNTYEILDFIKNKLKTYETLDIEGKKEKALFEKYIKFSQQNIKNVILTYNLKENTGDIVQFNINDSLKKKISGK